LEILPPNARKHNSAEMALEEIVSVMHDAHREGTDVVRLHSGDPSIYGAIREQMNELDRMGIEYEVVPGVSSFQASAAALKTELTAPEIAQTIILTRTSGRTPLPPEQQLRNLAATKATLCIFLSGKKIEEAARELAPFYRWDCPAAVVYHASWPDQKIVEGTLQDIAAKVKEAGIGETSLIVVGRALARNLPASKLYDAEFSHGRRQGKKK
ncbi:MAG TPA: precorrin-4 C(11)-methyltransferase, partial [Thermodesulfobacteriota bacterium]|nr:precorrin-4 C(11)-methyltransferase [Thermodesulfobacteriota bacterium]